MKLIVFGLRQQTFVTVVRALDAVMLVLSFIMLVMETVMRASMRSVGGKDAVELATYHINRR